MTRVLVTGIAGFAGSHLAGELLERGFEVWGTHIDGNLENLSHILASVKLLECDLLDRKRVFEVVDGAGPDYVVHLAALSAPALSFSDPGATLRTNIFSTLNLLEALSEKGPGAVFLNIGSGDGYGDAYKKDLPIREGSALLPLNTYAVSKITQDLLSYQYHRSRGLKVVRARPFNHLGPRQSERFAASSFAKQIAEIELGIKKDRVMKVGNLESERDFLHVKDVVNAYLTLMERGVYGEAYNICSGRPLKIRRILEILIGFSKEEITVVHDEERLRSADAGLIYGDPSKLKSLGWAPRYSIEEGLRELLDYWRKRLEKGSGTKRF